MPKGQKNMDPRMKQIIPPIEKIRQRILEALPPLISAEKQAENHWNETGQNLVVPATDPAIQAFSQGVRNAQEGSVFDDIPEF
jgi:hypothetical protein